jgi:hypothetical protein
MVDSIVCGDVNSDGRINILDVSSAIDYLYRSKPVANIYTVGDVDGNGDVNLLDVTYLINYLYRSGPEPAC